MAITLLLGSFHDAGRVAVKNSFGGSNHLNETKASAPEEPNVYRTSLDYAPRSSGAQTFPIWAIDMLASPLEQSRSYFSGGVVGGGLR